MNANEKQELEELLQSFASSKKESDKKSKFMDILKFLADKSFDVAIAVLSSIIQIGI